MVFIGFVVVVGVPPLPTGRFRAGRIGTGETASSRIVQAPRDVTNLGPLWQFLKRQLLMFFADAEHFHGGLFLSRLRAAVLGVAHGLPDPFLSAASASTWAKRLASLRACSSMTACACLASPAARFCVFPFGATTVRVFAFGRADIGRASAVSTVQPAARRTVRR